MLSYIVVIAISKTFPCCAYIQFKLKPIYLKLQWLALFLLFHFCGKRTKRGQYEMPVPTLFEKETLQFLCSLFSIPFICDLELPPRYGGHLVYYFSPTCDNGRPQE